jgi:hypothetical protein
MLVQLIFDKHEQAQAVYDLCAISNLDTFSFISPEDDDWVGIEILVTTIDHKFALRRIQDYVFDHFPEQETANP